MAVTLQLPKAKAKETAAKIGAKAKAKSKIEEAADKVIAIERQIQKMNIKELLKEQAEAMAVLKAAAADKPKNQEITFHGDGGVINFSTARMETQVVDRDGLIEALGQEVVNALFKIPITEVKKYLSDDQKEQFLKEERGDTRVAKVVVLT